MFKKLAWLLIFFCIGCSQKAKTPVVHIRLIGYSVQFSGLDKAILGDINRDSIPAVWETLLPVYKLPADTGLKDYQPVQHGIYVLKDSVVVFTPDTPFVKNQAYFMRFYQFDKGNTVWDFVKSHHKHGNTRYVDLGFSIK
jgi:hypothetical protein